MLLLASIIKKKITRKSKGMSNNNSHQSFAAAILVNDDDITTEEETVTTLYDLCLEDDDGGIRTSGSLNESSVSSFSFKDCRQGRWSASSLPTSLPISLQDLDMATHHDLWNIPKRLMSFRAQSLGLVSSLQRHDVTEKAKYYPYDLHANEERFIQTKSLIHNLLHDVCCPLMETHSVIFPPSLHHSIQVVLQLDETLLSSDAYDPRRLRRICFAIIQIVEEMYFHLVPLRRDDGAANRSNSSNGGGSSSGSSNSSGGESTGDERGEQQASQNVLVSYKKRSGITE